MSDAGALAGIRVLDASQMLAGPIACMRMADLGADVIKVEPPGTGEWTRTHGMANAYLAGETTAFLGINRNKRSLTLNLKSQTGRDLLYEMVRQSDVFVQNYRVGTAARLGVSYEDLHAINPRLIYCSITGYGEDGPGASRPGQDLVVQAMSGSMWSVGAAGEPPQAGALWAADVMTGYQAVIGILAALHSRATSGRGQRVSVDMLSTVMDCQVQELTTYLNLGIQPERSAEPLAHAFIPAPYGAYPTKDGWIVLAMAPVDKLGEVLGDDFLSGLREWDDGYVHRDEIYRRVRVATPTRTSADWIDAFDAVNVWAGEVYDYERLCADPQVVARGLITSVEHPTIGTLRLTNVPLEMSGTPASVRTAPPLLGQHTDEILGDLAGLGTERLAQLHTEGTI
jgi:crotonobetainyl-CoA:carnitine CoA-transferase CaiB-like acyl-CoA transferase